MKNSCIGYACDKYDPDSGCLYWMIGLFSCPYLKRKRKIEEIENAVKNKKRLRSEKGPHIS